MLAKKGADQYPFCMSAGMGIVIGIVVGAIATLFANLAAEWLRNRQTVKSNKKNVRLLLKVEFEAVLKYLDELKIVYSSTQQYPLRYADTIKSSTDILDGYKPSLASLQDEELQKKIAALITELSLFINDIQGLERASIKLVNGEKLGGLNEDWIKNERKNKQIEIVDFRRQLEEIIRDLN